jgi:hypothetical protein
MEPPVSFYPCELLSMMLASQANGERQGSLCVLSPLSMAGVVQQRMSCAPTTWGEVLAYLGPVIVGHGHFELAPLIYSEMERTEQHIPIAFHWTNGPATLYQALTSIRILGLPLTGDQVGFIDRLIQLVQVSIDEYTRVFDERDSRLT